jgi:hypothetical protein
MENRSTLQEASPLTVAYNEFVHAVKHDARSAGAGAFSRSAARATRCFLRPIPTKIETGLQNMFSSGALSTANRFGACCSTASSRKPTEWRKRFLMPRGEGESSCRIWLSISLALA